MDATQELVETLKAGQRVELVLGKTEPVQNAHRLFNRLEREHGLSIGRRPKLVNGQVSFVVWSVDKECERPLNEDAGIDGAMEDNLSPPIEE